MSQMTNRNLEMTNKSMDEMKVIWEIMMRRNAGKEPMIEVGQSSTQQNRGTGKLGTDKGIVGTGTVIDGRREADGHQRTQSDETFHVNTEEYN
jgi:hypothetical protein